MDTVPQSIRIKIGRNLHQQPNHPICIIKKIIADWFQIQIPETLHFEDFPPDVSVAENFDALLFPADHPARSKSDTFYTSETTVLRTHTSAHQAALLRQHPDAPGFLITGDVYRRDEIDARHFPVFHQMEGVFKVPADQDPVKYLQELLVNLCKYLFPHLCESNDLIRINPDKFPFTHPSFEIEISQNDVSPQTKSVSLPEEDMRWIEILGCGVVHPTILSNASLDPTKPRVAFGLGLERLAMLLFNIPDIRYFWSTSTRFLEQFTIDKWRSIQFKPFSDLPSQYNDIAFWIPSDQLSEGTWKQEHDFFDAIREIAGDWVESVVLHDEFVHPKTGKCSRMYRITYSPMDPDMKNSADFTKQCNSLQQQIREYVGSLSVELR